MKNLKLEDFSTQLSELKDKHAELHSKKSQRNADAAVIRERLNKKTPKPGNLADNLVNELLGEPNIPLRDDDVIELQKVLVELEALNKATSILHAKIRNEEYAASIKACEHIAPEHKRYLQKVVGALTALHSAHVDYVAFFDNIERDNVATGSLHRFWPSALGDPRDPNGTYWFMFKDLREDGHIERKDIPEAIRS